MSRLTGWFGSGLFVLHFWSTLPVFAQRELKDIPDPDPEIERKSFIVADGFEVNLFAADPLIHKPIQMNFDPQGRLWIAASETYPQIAPGQKANDKILVLEDTDGDGRSDKTTVFADGLLIPTGVEPGDGGAYVAASTELLHLKDTDGDGHADESRVVLSGFGTEDTHHILHTLRWGPDGMLYMNQSVYIHSHIETPHGVRRLNAGGIWQFRPETMKLEVFARGFVNPWGHAFDDYGVSFATDGAGGEGINYVVPGASYVTAFGAERILSGLNPGSPKLCGLEILSGRHLPDDWQGNLISNDFRGHRVCRYTVSEDGAGFTSREMPELIKTNHVAFRPIDVKMGPDGAIYIADWYNPIIQHGEVDFRDPRRDHTHGRIWRVTAKNRPLGPRPKLVGATVPELLDHLKAPEQWTRHQTKRVLKELALHGKAGETTDENKRLTRDLVSQNDVGKKGAAAEPRKPNQGARIILVNQFGGGRVLPKLGETLGPGQLKDWGIRSIFDYLKDLDPRDPLIGRHRLEALWLLQTIDSDVFSTLAPDMFLLAPDHRVRAAATRIAHLWTTRIKRRDPLLTNQVEDEHPRVRLEAVRAVGSLPAKDYSHAEAVLKAIDKPVDKWLGYAIWLTMQELVPEMKRPLETGLVIFTKDNEEQIKRFAGGNAKHLSYAIKSTNATSAIPTLVKLLAAGKVAEADQAEVIQVIASLGGPNELKLVLDVAQAEATPSARRAALLNELAATARKRNVKPSGDLAEPLLVWLHLAEASDHQAELTAAINCAGAWKVEKLRGDLEAVVNVNNVMIPQRQAALEAIAELGGPQATKLLVTHAGPKEYWPVRLTSLAALSALDLKLATAMSVEMLQDIDKFPISSEAGSQRDPTPLINALLQRKGGPEELAAALANKKLPPDAAKVALRTLDASGRQIPALSEAITKAGGLTSGPRELSADEMRALVAEVAAKGNAHRGEAIYRRKGLDCQKCHAIGGAGGRVGPDLISLGSSAQVDYIAESLLAPNKKVKENFNSLVVVTDDGKVRSGIKLRQTDTDLLLRDAEDNEFAIPLKKIEEQINGASLMPAGLADKLTRTELIDLVRFLSELGKVGDFQIKQQPVVRRWQTLVLNDASILQLRRVSYASIAQNDAALTWTPAYSTVGGDLPLTDLPEFRIPFRAKEGQLGVTFIRFELDASSAGQAKLRLNSVAGLSAWLDANPIKLTSETTLDLSAGRHRVTFAIELSERQETLRVELADGPGFAAKVQLVSGK